MIWFTMKKVMITLIALGEIDVKEKTNVIQAAATIGGINRGSHKFLMRESLVRPWGRSRNCSSSSGFIEDNSGSQNRINNAMLNHA